MRAIDNDQLQPLGKKIERPAMPEPHRKVADGIYKAPDGKMYTNIPEPPQAPTIYDLLQQAMP